MGKAGGTAGHVCCCAGTVAGGGPLNDEAIDEHVVEPAVAMLLFPGGDPIELKD